MYSLHTRRSFVELVRLFLIYELPHLHGIWGCHQQIDGFTQHSLRCIAGSKR